MKRTMENLAKAFIGESQARNRYTYYSKIAQKEGYEQIAELFLITADNEREHAKWLMRLINQLKEESGEEVGSLKVEAEVPTTLGNTAENIKAAIAGENYEYTQMYPGFADIAKEEGMPTISGRLRAIAKAESHHEDRYIKLLEVVENQTAFKKEEKVTWVCRKCGYVHDGFEPPQKCPSCDHPASYFQLKCAVY